MTERQITTKAELLVEIERTWMPLTTAIDRLTEAQLTVSQDAQGWTAKDHLVHLVAWERSVVFLLQGRPRYEGLGVAESVYLSGDEDEINAVIQQMHKNHPLADVLAQFRSAHQQLLALLQPLSDADLNKPYHHYLPDESGSGEGPLIINVIYSNSANHFAEHLTWIETLVANAV